MGYQLTIEIPTEATDSNRILGQNKFVKNEIFKKIKRDIGLLVTGKKPDKPLESFTVSVIREGVKSLDFDNFIASLKPFIDGLVVHGVIKDDSWKYIRNINASQMTGNNKRLVIMVKEV